MNIVYDTNKKKKVDCPAKRQLSLFFNVFPDEIVLIILSYGTLPDINSTRIWQTKIVQHCTGTNIMKDAIEKGNLNNVKWIWENNTNWDEYKDALYYFTLAASLGHFKVVKWLHGVKCLEGEYACSDDGFYHYTNAMSMAADFGNLEMMKWLNEKDYEFDRYTFGRAFRNGNLDNLKWLKNMGCEWGDFEEYSYSRIVNEALVYNGSLENIHWAKENGFQFNEISYVVAAKYGNVRILQWLKNYEIPIDTKCFEEAARHGNMKVMDWLNCEFDPRRKPFRRIYSRIKKSLEWR